MNGKLGMHTESNMGRLTKHLPFPRPPQEVQEGEKEKKDEDKEKEKKKEAEPNFQLLENPARVMPAQLKVLTMPESCRYQPFKPVGALRPGVFTWATSQVIDTAAHTELVATFSIATRLEVVNHFLYLHRLTSPKLVKLSPAWVHYFVLKDIVSVKFSY